MHPECTKVRTNFATFRALPGHHTCSLMILQPKLLPEFHSTLIACEHFVVLVDFLMQDTTVPLVEPAVTEGTLIGFLTRVGADMGLQGVASPKCFLTNPTTVSFFSCVNALVNVQGIASSETLPTVFALKRALSCMDATVFSIEHCDG